jgi:proline iminopeptidase
LREDAFTILRYNKPCSIQIVFPLTPLMGSRVFLPLPDYRKKVPVHVPSTPPVLQSPPPRDEAGYYPPIQPYHTFRLPVSKFHTLYVEECGNPNGIPVVFLHGGPGSGCSEKHRQLFDPTLFRIIIHDQRGAGRSTPHASLQENTTWHLVSDINAIRQHLKIDRWLVFGGSWGSTLALAYAQTFPEQVGAMVLRGIFTGTDEEIQWFYQAGAHRMSPHLWEAFESLIPEAERHDMIAAYYKRLTGVDKRERLEACTRWAKWEVANCTLVPDEAFVQSFTADHHAISLARIECHYFINRCFFTGDTQLLHPSRLKRIEGIPLTIVQGRYDLVCPPKQAWELHKALPHSTLNLIDCAGHASSEPGILEAQHNAIHQYATEWHAAGMEVTP